MPRKPRPPGEKPETIRVTINPMVRQYLEKLRATGLYGNDHSQAALKLVTIGIENAIATGVIAKIDSQS